MLLLAGNVFPNSHEQRNKPRLEELVGSAFLSNELAASIEDFVGSTRDHKLE